MKSEEVLKVNPSIDKNFGIVNDCILISYLYDEEIKIVDIEHPSLKPKIWEKVRNKSYCGFH